MSSSLQKILCPRLNIFSFGKLRLKSFRGAYYASPINGQAQYLRLTVLLNSNYVLYGVKVYFCSNL
jgi:hypothetical protein